MTDIRDKVDEEVARLKAQAKRNRTKIIIGVVIAVVIIIAIYMNS